ncbi:hypothetical protein HPB52_001918 [Rhipicephalus sanguineus]|uniref:Uncharacterized protein n=1 Tax=Rhipicephalus sanguineus TaxID=34632 RepID=A0A9D4QI34_RHISA|nr:hypothetical protein HPB52_001918 [Rhipicephalus sanguineus]
MAGNDEACSHVAALLFYVEYGVRVRQERSCTDSTNSWLPTHIRKLDVRHIAKMYFALSMKKRRLVADVSAAREPKSPCRASSTHWRLWPCETEYTNALLKAMPASAAGDPLALPALRQLPRLAAFMNPHLWNLEKPKVAGF